MNAVCGERRVGDEHVDGAGRTTREDAACGRLAAAERPRNVEHGEVVDRRHRWHAGTKRDDHVETVHQLRVNPHSEPGDGPTDAAHRPNRHRVHASWQPRHDVLLDDREQLLVRDSWERTQELTDIGLDAAAPRPQRQRVQRDSVAHVPTTPSSIQKYASSG